MKRLLAKSLWPLLLVVVSGNSLAEEDKGYWMFYYRDAETLSKRAQDYLNGEYEGILIGYPGSKGNREEQKSEDVLVVAYGMKATDESVARDLQNAHSKNHNYGLLMMRGSLMYCEPSAKLAFVEKSRELLGEDRKKNAVLAYLVRSQMTSDSFEIEDKKLFKKKAKAFLSFADALEKHGADAAGRKLLEGVEKGFYRDALVALIKAIEETD